MIWDDDDLPARKTKGFSSCPPALDALPTALPAFRGAIESSVRVFREGWPPHRNGKRGRAVVLTP